MQSRNTETCHLLVRRRFWRGICLGQLTPCHCCQCESEFSYIFCSMCSYLILIYRFAARSQRFVAPVSAGPVTSTRWSSTQRGWQGSHDHRRVDKHRQVTHASMIITGAGKCFKPATTTRWVAHSMRAVLRFLTVLLTMSEWNSYMVKTVKYHLYIHYIYIMIIYPTFARAVCASTSYSLYPLSLIFFTYIILQPFFFKCLNQMSHRQSRWRVIHWRVITQCQITYLETRHNDYVSSPFDARGPQLSNGTIHVV